MGVGVDGVIVQSLSCVQLFATPWSAAHQASLSFTISRSLDWKRPVFIPIPKKGNAKEYSNYHTIALMSHASK